MIVNDKELMMAYSSQSRKSRFWANVIEIAGLLFLVFLIRTVGFGLYQVPTGSMETTMLVGERFFADKLTYFFRGPRHGEVIAFNEPPTHYDYSENKLINLYQSYVWGPSNWTKRVIGVPGDEIKGVIEDGKPVIYRNGEKLHETYLNKYPLIHVLKYDPQVVESEINQEIRKMRGRDVDQIRWQLRHMYETTKSYDPNVSFADQPFYRIYPNRVVDQDETEYLWPYDAVDSKYRKYVGHIQRDGNYWDESDEFYVNLGPDEYWLMGDNRRGSHDSRFFGPIKRSFIHGRIIFLIWSIDSDESWWILDLIKHPIDFWKRVRWSRFFKWIN